MSLFRDFQINSIEENGEDCTFGNECECGGIYERMDENMLTCAECGIMLESPIKDSSSNDIPAAMVRGKGRNGAFIRPKVYDQKESVMENIRTGLSKMGKPLDEKYIYEIATLIVVARDGRPQRGNEANQFLGGGCYIICNWKYNMSIPSSALAKAFVNSGGISPGINKITNALFRIISRKKFEGDDFENPDVNAAQAIKNYQVIVNQPEAIKCVTKLAVRQIGIDEKNEFMFIYKCVNLPEILRMDLGKTVNARLAGSLHFFFRHVKQKNNIKECIKVANITTEETALQYYGFLISPSIWAMMIEMGKLANLDLHQDN